MELLMNSINIDGHNVDIIILNNAVHVYLLEIDNQIQIYMTDMNNKNHVPELFKVFNSKEDALQFAVDFWASRKKVILFINKFHATEDTPATERQIKTTNGIATTYGETTWYFAKNTCQRRLTPIIKELQGSRVNHKVSDYELFKIAE